jgi:hypothetical protein
VGPFKSNSYFQSEAIAEAAAARYRLPWTIGCGRFSVDEHLAFSLIPISVLALAWQDL